MKTDDKLKQIAEEKIKAEEKKKKEGKATQVVIVGFIIMIIGFIVDEGFLILSGAFIGSVGVMVGAWYKEFQYVFKEHHDKKDRAEILSKEDKNQVNRKPSLNKLSDEEREKMYQSVKDYKDGKL